MMLCFSRDHNCNYGPSQATSMRELFVKGFTAFTAPPLTLTSASIKQSNFSVDGLAISQVERVRAQFIADALMSDV